MNPVKKLSANVTGLSHPIKRESVLVPIAPDIDVNDVSNTPFI